MLGLFRNRDEVAISRVYGEILAQARQPSLFVEHAVPDTVEGRTDMMILHVVLVVRRLGSEGEKGRAAAQAVCDRFFAELDRALREMGVGDLAVPKRMKSIAEIYAGCASAYAAALDQSDDRALAAALARNVYSDPTEAAAPAVPLAAYVRRVAARLASTPFASLWDRKAA